MTDARTSVLFNETQIIVDLPRADLLSMDLDYRFLAEETTFLNRLTPEDRNEILASIKKEVTKSLKASRFQRQAQERIRSILNEVGTALGKRVKVSVAGATAD